MAIILSPEIQFLKIMRVHYLQNYIHPIYIEHLESVMTKYIIYELRDNKLLHYYVYVQ